MTKSEIADVERRYEAAILRLEGKLADAWDSGWEAGNDYALITPTAYATNRSANPYRTENQ